MKELDILKDVSIHRPIWMGFDQVLRPRYWLSSFLLLFYQQISDRQV